MPNKIIKPSTFLISCIVTINSFAQTNNYESQKFAPALLRNDLSLLRDTIQKIHPAIYRYKNKAAMDHLFDSCFATINDSRPTIDFFALTSFIIASIGDGHTNCKLSAAVMKDYLSRTKLFPAMVMFIHNRAFIYCCNQNDGLNASELIAINNHSLTEIIQKLFKYIQSDAYIQSHKNWELNESFPLLFNILYGTKDNYNVSYKTQSGEIKTATLQADTLKNILCPPPFSRPKKYLQLTYESKDVAVLSVKTFFDGFLKQTGESFTKFLDSAFTDIKNNKIKKLLIDIRGNQGGNDGNGELLYSYLTAKPFMYYSSQETNTEKFSPKDHPNLLLQQPKENNFSGKVFVLVDGRSFSASSEFSSIVRTNGRGKFIGEECGGGYYGNTSGDEVFVTLPNTQITIRIPTVKYSMAVKSIGNKIWSIQPDYPVYSTVTDIIEKKDGQLEYAIKLVENK
ncbi:MAG TPA: S41 family peptidase [Chitinophagaceae bacterium]|jgi:hypothetical protein|nr:S41 family peptidase [Chitinophagaceae bacterium]